MLFHRKWIRCVSLDLHILFLFLDMLDSRWEITTVLEQDRHGLMVYNVLDQKLTFSDVVTVAGVNTAVNTPRMFPSVASPVSMVISRLTYVRRRPSEMLLFFLTRPILSGREADVDQIIGLTEVRPGLNSLFTIDNFYRVKKCEIGLISERTNISVPKSRDGVYSLWAVKVQGGPKNGTVFWYALTSSNINRFSKLFHRQNQENICNNTITKDPTTPQGCRYTTLWNVKCLKSNNWKKTTSVTTHF